MYFIWIAPRWFEEKFIFISVDFPVLFERNKEKCMKDDLKLLENTNKNAETSDEKYYEKT